MLGCCCFYSEADDALVNEVLLCRWLSEWACCEVRHDWDDDVLVYAEVEEESFEFSVFRHVADARVDHGSWLCEWYLLLVDADLSLCAWVEAEDRVEEFAASCADESSDADDLARVDFEADVVEEAGRVDFANVEEWCFGCCRVDAVGCLVCVVVRGGERSDRGGFGVVLSFLLRSFVVCGGGVVV